MFNQQGLVQANAQPTKGTLLPDDAFQFSSPTLQVQQVAAPIPGLNPQPPTYAQGTANYIPPAILASLGTLTPQVVEPAPANVSGDRMSNLMTKVWDVETKGGTLADRPGSQYKGIGQLGNDIRKPLLKEYGYTEAQYDASKDIQKELSTAHFNNLKKRMGDSASDLDLWGGQNMGVAGWNQIKSGKVSPTVLKNLRNQKGMNSKSTPEDYIAYYGKIFN